MLEEFLIFGLGETSRKKGMLLSGCSSGSSIFLPHSAHSIASNVRLVGLDIA